MLYLFLVAIALVLPSPVMAQAKQRIVFDGGYCVKDTAGNLTCEIDSAADDGIETKTTAAGDIHAKRCFVVGDPAGVVGTGSPPAAGTCICRFASTDQLYGDKNCSGVKDAGEDFLDGVGAGGGDNLMVNGTATTSAQPNLLDSGAITWTLNDTTGNITGALGASAVTSTKIPADGLYQSTDFADNVVPVNALNRTGSPPADLQCLKYDVTTDKFEWGDCATGAGIISPASPPLAPVDSPEAFRWDIRRIGMNEQLVIEREWSPVEEGAPAFTSIDYANFADIGANCNASSVGYTWLIVDSQPGCNGGGGSNIEACTCTHVGSLPQETTAACMTSAPVACNAASNGSRRIVLDALNSSSCTTGGGTARNECVCNGSSWVDATPTVAYKLMPNLEARDFWLHSFTGSDDGGYGNFYRHSGLDFADPYVRIGDATAGNCTQEQWVWGDGNKFGYEGRPGESVVSMIQAQLTDDTVLSVSVPNRLDDTIAFWGWIDHDARSDTVINPAGTTPQNTMVSITNGYGLLWRSPKFYLVFIRNGGAVQSSVLLDLTNNTDRTTFVQAHRALLNVAIHIRYASAIAGDTSAKEAAYRQGFEVTTQSAMTASLEALPTTGTVDMYAHPNLVPVIAACAKTGATYTSEAFFQQMSIIHEK